MLFNLAYIITCFFIGFVAGTTTRAHTDNPWIGYPMAFLFTGAAIYVMGTFTT